MRVTLSHLNRRVTENIPHYQQRNTLLHHTRGARVPEIVNPKRNDSRPFASPLKPVLHVLEVGRK